MQCLIASVSIFVCLYLGLCLLSLYIKTHVRKRKGNQRKGKPEDSPNGHLLCSFSQAEEGQYGNCFQLHSLQIFPDRISASLTLPGRVSVGPRPFSKHQSADAKQGNYNSGPNCRTHCLAEMRLQWVRLFITRLLCTQWTLICCREVKDRDKELQSYRDGKQDRSNDTQQVIRTLITLISSVKGGLGLNISREASSFLLSCAVSSNSEEKSST